MLFRIWLYGSRGHGYQGSGECEGQAEDYFNHTLYVLFCQAADLRIICGNVLSDRALIVAYSLYIIGLCIGNPGGVYRTYPWKE